MRVLLLHVLGKDAGHVTDFIVANTRNKDCYNIVHPGLILFNTPDCFPYFWNILAYITRYQETPESEPPLFSVTADPTHIITAMSEEKKHDVRLFLKRHTAPLEIWDLQGPATESSSFESI